LKSEFVMAINQICSERNLSQEVIFEAIESALVSAYRRNFGGGQNVKAVIDTQTGAPHVFLECIVVEQVEDDRFEITLREARRIVPEAQIGDLVKKDVTPKSFGRIAAQTAKQVILQRIREAERDALFSSYADREGELINGMVANVTSHAITLNLGRTEATMPRGQQMPGERYRIGQRIRAYVMEVRRSSRGPQIVVSRTHRHMLRRLLELEVPEIYNGTVEIKAIAREAGSRSKVAVAALQEGVDPVGSCVGIRGMRIQSIVNELGGEKIDVVEWSPDVGVFIANALSPAKVRHTVLGDPRADGKTATVVVPDDQLSLAIGKEGQNARLAAKLTGWRIDIKSYSEAQNEDLKPQGPFTLATSKEKDILAMAEAILLGKAVGEREPAEAEEAALAPVQEVEAEAIEPGPAEQVTEMEAEAVPAGHVTEVETEAASVEQAAEAEVEPVIEVSEKVEAEAVAPMDAESESAQEERADDASLLEAAEAILRGEPLPVQEAEELEAPVEAQAVADERTEPEPQVVEPEMVALGEETPAEPVQASVTEEEAEAPPETEEKVILRRTTGSKPERRSMPRYQYVRDEQLEELDQPTQKSRRRKRRRLVLDEETGNLVSERMHKREDDQETTWEN
jgi:N utilization substance protein A